MKIELKEITIREVSKEYFNDNEEGVVGFNGKLNIRPKYQREFVYKDKQRDAVIETVIKNFPLNVMYCVVNKNTQSPDCGNKIDKTVAKYGFTASELCLGVSTYKTTSNKAQNAKALAKYANHANPEKTLAGGKVATPLCSIVNLST